MRKLIFLGAVVLLMALALAAEAAPAGPAETIAAEGAAVTFGAPLQEPEIIISADSITVEGADATFGAPLREP